MHTGWRGIMVRTEPEQNQNSTLTDRNQVWWIEEWNVCPVSVVDCAPSKVENFIFFFRCILAVLLFILHILNELDQWTVRMVQDETAVHEFQQEEFTLQDMLNPVWELIRERVQELVLHWVRGDWIRWKIGLDEGRLDGTVE